MDVQVTLGQLLELFPSFKPVWESEHNYFRHDESFTLCGVFSRFSQFFCERYEHFSPAQLISLGAFVSECASSPDAALRDAVLTCFLENVEGERFSPDFRHYLRGEALQFYSSE